MAAGDMREYDPNRFFVSLAGIPISGWAEGEMINVDRETDDFDDVCGTDGEVTRSMSNDNRATITIRLMQTSPTNALLSILRTLDKSTPNGAGVGPFLAREIGGTTQLMAEKAWIAKSPPSSWDKTAKEREWKIRCANLIEHHGGN